MAISLCLLFSSENASSQAYIYRQKQLNVFSNTFNHEINCITYDDHGFIWMGTAFGLYRFDGYNTDPIVYYNKDSFRFSPEIHDIQYLDKHIYIATNHGLFIVETGNIKYNSHPFNIQKKETIYNLIADNESGIWWLSHNGTLYNYHKKKLKSIQLPFLANQHIAMICHSNTIWIVSDNSNLFGVDKYIGEIKYKQKLSLFNQINNLAISKSNNVGLCTDKGFFEILKNETNTIKLVQEKAYGDSIRNVLSNDEFTIISHMNSNLFHLDWQNETPKKILINDNRDNNYHTSRMIWYYNQLLIPGRTGLGVVQINKNNFNTIFPINNNFNGDSRGISEDDHYLYLFTYNNIARYHKKNHTTEIISNEKLISHGIYRDGKTIWIASESNGLIKFNTETFKTEHLFKNLPDKYKALVCITPLGNDTLILGAFKRYFIYNKKNGQITEKIPVNQIKQPITQGHFRQIDTLNRNTLLVATRDGLFKISLAGKLIKEYGASNDTSLIKNMNCFWINKRKQIWAGTSDGIVIFDSSGKELTKINYQSGLAGNKIAGMLNDNYGNLWVGTFNGLSKISTSDLSIVNYYTAHGLPDDEFNHASFYTTNDKQFIMGTMRGFISFDPSQFKEQKKLASTLTISKIEQEHNGVLEQILYNNEIKLDEIQLGKEITYLKLFFCRLPIQLFTEINFTYKIQKLIPQSVDITDKPIITLSDSEPGKFDIEITTNDATGSSGIFNKIIQYRVNQYFYVNKWFYFISTLFFLLLIIAYLYTLNIQKTRAFHTRNEIARDLHDEIGGSLTAISLYTEMLSDQKPPTKNQIESIQYTTRKLLVSFRDTLWSLNTNSDNAQQFWDHIKDMVTELTGNLNIEISFDEPEGLAEIIFPLNVKRNLLLAIKEGVNNAIKHGDKKHITLKWMKENRNHCIILMNTIKDINSNNIFTISNGIGLNSMQKRLHDIGGNIHYHIEGNRFTIEYQLNFIV